jgi:hypothetical protein
MQRPSLGRPGGGVQDLVEVGGGAPLVLGQRMHIHAQREGAAVGVAELGGDIGRRDAGGGQERRGRVAQGVQVHLGREAGPGREAPELTGDVLGWQRGPLNAP